MRTRSKLMLGIGVILAVLVVLMFRNRAARTPRLPPVR